MPEIAEVETIKNDLLLSDILGQKIINVELFNTSILNVSKSVFIKKITNNCILDISRKGKYLIFKMKRFFLIIHLKMTGHLLLKDKPYILKKHELVCFFFENKKKLIFFDPRRFGKIYLSDNLSILNKLGPDILSGDFQFSSFYEKLKTRKKKIKTLLLDQTFAAGIGNIYADEILFSAKIHPASLASRLNKQMAKTLFSSILEVIKKATVNRGTSLGTSGLNYTSINGEFGTNQNYLLVHTKEKCPNCLSEIQKVKINQRTSHFCKNCQKLPH